MVPPPIVNGDETTDYDEVVLLYLLDGHDEVLGSCTGSLLNAEWVLTAAHCVDLTVYDIELGGVYVSVADGSDDIVASVSALDWYVHPEYDAEGYNDVALLRLAAPLDLRPMAIDIGGVTTGDLGRQFRGVGFGLTGSFDDGEVLTKRYGDIEMTRLDERLLGLYEQGGQGLCFGDSGGPVLRVEDDATYSQTGITNFLWLGAGCEDSTSFAARIDYYLPWIENYTSVYTPDDLVDWESSRALSDPDDPRGGPRTGVPVDDPDRPDVVDEDYAVCAAAPGSCWFALLSLVIVLQRRR